jgi:hypothetical protein
MKDFTNSRSNALGTTFSRVLSFTKTIEASHEIQTFRLVDLYHAGISFAQIENEEHSPLGSNFIH